MLSRAFFERYFQRSFFWFHCHSWLLSPALRDLLSPASGILQFQRFLPFTVKIFIPAGRATRFRECTGRPTAVYRAHQPAAGLKKYLLAGNHVGMGMGVAQRVSIEAVGEAAGAGPLHGFIP